MRTKPSMTFRVLNHNCILLELWFARSLVLLPYVVIPDSTNTLWDGHLLGWIPAIWPGTWACDHSKVKVGMAYKWVATKKDGEYLLTLAQSCTWSPYAYANCISYVYHSTRSISFCYVIWYQLILYLAGEVSCHWHAGLHVQQRQNYMALELGIAVTNTSNKTPDCPVGCTGLDGAGRWSRYAKLMNLRVSNGLYWRIWMTFGSKDRLDMMIKSPRKLIVALIHTLLRYFKHFQTGIPKDPNRLSSNHRSQDPSWKGRPLWFEGLTGAIWVVLAM